MKCIDCKEMVCRVFYPDKETWQGYCIKKNKKVRGDYVCQ